MARHPSEWAKVKPAVETGIEARAKKDEGPSDLAPGDIAGALNTALMNERLPYHASVVDGEVLIRDADEVKVHAGPDGKHDVSAGELDGIETGKVRSTPGNAARSPVVPKEHRIPDGKRIVSDDDLDAPPLPAKAAGGAGSSERVRRVPHGVSPSQLQSGRAKADPKASPPSMTVEGETAGGSQNTPPSSEGGG
jgi:hypothetical protein